MPSRNSGANRSPSRSLDQKARNPSHVNALLVFGAFASDPCRLRKVFGVAPHCGKTVRRAVHELPEVTLPASVVIAQEEEPASASASFLIELHPAGEVNAGDAAERALEAI